MKRVPPSVKMKEEVERLLKGEAAPTDEVADPVRGFLRQLARYVLQVHIEAEATEFLGRGHYRRGERRRPGWRNGYEPKGIQTESGLMRLHVPQVRETAEPFRSALLKRVGSRSDDLEALVTGMYVRGLSTQDVGDHYGETFGESRLNQDFDAWKKRDLSGLKVVYLFLDRLYHAVRQGTEEKEGVLSAHALLEDGSAVLLHLDLGPREFFDAWLSFLQDMTARGLSDPLMVIFDGNPGLKKAIRRVWPRAFRQRRQAHKMRNILSKLPRLMQAKMKQLVLQVFLAPSYEAAVKRGRTLIARFKDRYTAAMECLEKDLEECVTSLRFPEEHDKRIRTTNRPARLQGEGRRRTKVIPRFPTERSCLALLYATLIAASAKWRGVRMTPAILRRLDALRRETFTESNEAVA